MKSIRIVAIATAVSIFALQASAQTPTQQPPTAKASTNTIMDVARGSKSNSTMLSAVKAAGMEETLNGSGPYTVFAPSNEAFSKLSTGKADSLFQPEGKKDLNNILSYHVVQGNHDFNTLSADIEKGNGKAVLNTVSGEILTASLENGKIILTDSKGGKATVATNDIKSSNGVYHVIDSVLSPEAK